MNALVRVMECKSYTSEGLCLECCKPGPTRPQELKNSLRRMGPSAALGACLEPLTASVSLLLVPLLLCLLLFEALPLESLPCLDLDFLLFFSFRFESLPCFAFEDLPALLTPPLAFKLPLWPPSRASLSAASCALNSLQSR